MSKNVLIVENDSGLSHSMRDALASRGFTVKETNDGKGCQETMRRDRPDLLVLAVDLSAGQNGYIICGKLKKDDDIKAIPVVIVGNPDGFANHKKLKTRADDYLAKPFSGDAIVDRVGALIGYPEPPADEALASSDLEDLPVDEITIDPQTSEETVGGDPDLDMIDRVFDDRAEPPTAIGRPIAAPPPPPPASGPAASGKGDGGELRELKAKVAELKAALTDATNRASDAESKARGLEGQLDARSAELEANKSTGGKSDKEVFSLRDSVNKKDKEILRLKSELNAKEAEIVEQHEKVNALEQQLSELSAEAAKKDAQLKTQAARADQLGTERKRMEQQLATAKDEARASASQLAALQTDFDGMQEKQTSSDRELETLRARNGELESSLGQTQSDLAEAKGEIEAVKTQLEEKTREGEEARAHLETTQIDLDSAKNQLTTQATAFAEETQSNRRKVSDLQSAARRHEERATRLQARVKADEATRDRTREALKGALEVLEEQPLDVEDVEEIPADDLAEA